MWATFFTALTAFVSAITPVMLAVINNRQQTENKITAARLETMHQERMAALTIKRQVTLV